MLGKKNRSDLERYQFFFLKEIKTKNFMLSHSSFTKLNNLMTQSLATKTLSIALLFGCDGSGRQTAVKLASINNKVDEEIMLDAKMLDQDNIIQRELLQRLYKTILTKKNKDGITKEIHEMEDEEIENIKEKIYKKAFVNKNIVIYIDNIDVLLMKNRQTFFYTFLDDLKFYPNKPFLVLGTNNLYILDLLERRVKSRFTHTSFFFGMQEQTLKDYLSHLKISDSQNDQKIIHLLQHPIILEKLQFLFEVQANYDLIFKVLGGAFVLMNENDLSSILESKDLETGVKLVEGFLDKSIELFIGTNLSEIITSLPDVDKIILKDLYEIWKQEDPSVIMVVKDLLNYRSENYMKYHLKFTNQAIFKALKNLHNLNVIYVQDIPITLYSRFCIKFEHDVIHVINEE